MDKVRWRNDPMLKALGNLGRQIGTRQIHNEIRIEFLDQAVTVAKRCDRNERIANATPKCTIQRHRLERC